MSIADQLAALSDQRDRLASSTATLGATLSEAPTFQEIADALDELAMAYVPAYAAVYGTTLVFGRGVTAPETYTADDGVTYELKTAYDSAGGFDIENVNYTDSGDVPWKSCGTVDAVKVIQPVRPVSTGYWFYQKSGVTKMDLAKLDTSAITGGSMICMFQGCRGLKTVGADESCDLVLPQGFGANVTAGAMAYMFDGCTNITSIDLPQGFASQVASGSLEAMFQSCNSLTELALPEGFAGNVTSGDMGLMFAGCTALAHLDLPEGFASKAYGSLASQSMYCGMTMMFYNCSGLEALALPEGFGAGAPIQTAGMFCNCSSLKKLDLSDLAMWQNRAVVDMFADMTALEEITLGESFSFAGNGSTSCTLPTPSADFIDGADGNWYDADGNAYAPADLQASYNGATMAGTYYATYAKTSGGYLTYKAASA